jgi:BirA family biotin operon repressor/biotin-[acetyl-CoA-carboxylase] ligase
MINLVGNGAGPGLLPDRVTLEIHEVLDSTNLTARERALAGAETWTVVQAAEQRAGRGRRERQWTSPRGNLYTSTILRPQNGQEGGPQGGPQTRAQLSFVAALAVAEAAAQAVPGTDIQLKWPNDVLADARKLSGILLETVVATGGGGVVIVGVGINIASFPAQTRYGATCLDLLAGRPITVEAVRARYLMALTHWYDIWAAQGFSKIRAAWLERAFGLGREVEVDDENGLLLQGRFTGLGEDGRMLLELPDGAVRLIAAGTVGFVQRTEA